MMLKTGLFIRNDDILNEAVNYLFNNTKLKYIVFKNNDFNQNIYDRCKTTDTICMNHQEFENKVSEKRIEELDYIFSYYYQKKLSRDILVHPIKGCINFHPAPLPYYRGVGNYSKFILEGLDYWGVSAHFMDELYDNGKIIRVLKFDVDSSRETYIGLENKTYKYMHRLFCTIIDDAITNNIKTQDILVDKSKVSYLTRSSINKLKLINDKDDMELIDRKIRAFWCPPFSGASVNIGNKNYTLVDDSILKELKDLYREKYRR